MWQRWWRRWRKKDDLAATEQPATMDTPATRPAPAHGQTPAGDPRRPKAGARRVSPTRTFLRHGVHAAFTEGALREAWRSVRANGGGPGVDGVAIEAFETRLVERLATLQAELVRGVYRPLPVRRVLVPKRGEGVRPLAIWTLRDRVAQRAVLNWLEPFFEPMFLDCSYGFRPGRSVEMAAQAVLRARDEGLRWVVDTDIKECFDSIDGDLAARLVRRRVKDGAMLRLVDLWLGVEVLEAHGGTRRAGAAQGGILSPLLCNIYLHAFDQALMARGRRLIRYADDFVILCRRRQEAEAALEEARALLAEVKLELKVEKTHIKHFDEGFKFLGIFFVGQRHYQL